MLRAGTAHERSSGWHPHGPALVSGAPPAPLAPLAPVAWQPRLDDAEPAIRDKAAAARAAGIDLPEPILAELVAVTPRALLMAARIARGLPQSAEVSGMFDPMR